MKKKLATLVFSLLMAGVVGATERPSLVLGDDPDRPGCSEVQGRYVALLVPGHGALVLSRAEFPGARVVGSLSRGGLEVTVPGAGGWDHAAADGEGRVWGLFHRDGLQGSAPGCVAFDKDRFTWSDDLLTYVRWVVEEAYLSLPAPTREQALPLLVSDRPVVLRAGIEGRGSVELEGKEASTLAFRLPDGDRTYLLQPFVIDGPGRILAVHVEATEGRVLGASEKRTIGRVLVGPEPVEVSDGERTIQLQVIGVGLDAD